LGLVGRGLRQTAESAAFRFVTIDGVGEGRILLADSAYDSDALRQKLRDRGAWANIRPMPGRKPGRYKSLDPFYEPVS